MKRVIALVLSLVSTTAWAAPSAQVNVDANTTTCVWSSPPIAPAPTTVTAAAGKCTFDVNALSPGEYTANVLGKNSLGQGGPSANLPFTMPGVPAAPSGLQLLP